MVNRADPSETCLMSDLGYTICFSINVQMFKFNNGHIEDGIFLALFLVHGDFSYMSHIVKDV